MAMQYLFPPTTQFQARTGANLTAGFLRVYYTQTDDRAPTYSDFGGTVNEDDIVLDNDGRAVVIVDDTKTYRLEVYTYNGALLFAVDPLYAVGVGGGSSNIVKIISSDGTVKIQAVSGGGITYYDLSTALTPTASKWGNVLGTVSGLDGTDEWEEIVPTVTIGTSTYDYGWAASKDTGYDIAASVEMPSGVAGALYGIEVKCEIQVDGVTVQTEYGYIDPSESMGRVSFEWKGQLSENQKVDCKLYAKCAQALTVDLAARALFNEECDGIVGNGGGGGGAAYEAGQYIDINSANVISVTGVQPASAMIFYAPNSALSGKQDTLVFNYNGPNISGINGSAIDAGAFNFSAGEYIDISGNVISVTGLQPVSGMSAYVERTAFDDCCSAMSGAVSSLQVDVSAISSVVSGITGATGDYVEKSSISAESSVWNTVTGKQDSGNYLSATESSNYILTSQSGLFQPSGDYLTSTASSNFLQTGDSALFQPSGSYLSSTESANFYPMTGNPSGFLTGHQDLSGYVEKSAISAESAQWNEVSAKQDASAMSSYVPFSAVESNTASAITAIGGSAIKGHEYTGISPVVVDNVNDEISVQHSSLTVDSSMTAYESAGYIVLGVNESALGLSAYIPVSALSGDGTSITSISGSSIGGTGDYVAKSSIAVAIGSGNAVSPWEPNFAQGADNTAQNYSLVQGTGNFASKYSLAQGYFNSAVMDSLVQGTQNSAYQTSLAQGHRNTASYESVAIGSGNYAVSNTLAQGGLNSASAASLAQGTENIADIYSFAQGGRNSASTTSFAQGFGLSAKNTAAAFGKYNLLGDGADTGDDIAFVIGDGTGSASRHDLLNVFKDGRIVTYSSTADTAGYDFKSAISSKLDTSAFSSVSGTFLTAVPAGYATESYVDSAVSGKLDATASSQFITALPADLATTADVASAASAKLDSSASSSFYPMTGNPSGFLTAHQSLAGYATEQYVDSSVSGKLDSTAYDSAQFYLTSNPSGFATTSYVDSAVSGVEITFDSSITTASGTAGITASVNTAIFSGKLDASAEVVTSIGVAAGALSSINGYGLSAGTANSAGTALYDSAGRALAGMATKAEASGAAMAYAESAISSVSGNYYPTSNPSGFISGVDLSDYATTAYVDSAVSGVEITFDSSISTASSTAGITASVNTAIFSGKLDATASGEFYPTSNPSGFITGVDLSNYATTSYVDSSVSGKLDASASSDFYSTSNPSGFITGVDLSNYATTSYVDSAVSGVEISFDSSITTASSTAGVTASVNTAIFSGKLDTTAFSTISANFLTSQTVTSLGDDGTYVTSINGSALSGVGGGIDSATCSAIASVYAESAVSAASSNYYSTSNPSGFISGVDLSPYQTTAGMTAYQPSGDYIYASALGTGEI